MGGDLKVWSEEAVTSLLGGHARAIAVLRFRNIYLLSLTNAYFTILSRLVELPTLIQIAIETERLKKTP